MKKFRNLTLSRMLLIFPGLTLLGLAALQTANSYLAATVERHVVFPNVEAIMTSDTRTMLQSLVDTQANTLGRRIAGLPREEQERFLIQETDALRFFDDRSGYYFVYDLNGTRVNVPTNKKDNGKNLMHLIDPNGVPFIRRLTEVSRSGGGFVAYVFDKPGNGIQPKVAYAARIPGTDYLIGTGVYMDNVAAVRTALRGRIAGERAQYNKFIAGLFLAILALTLAVSVGLSRSVAERVRGAVHELLQGAQQVASASAQLTVQSQTLASGANEQASQIDHTAEALAEANALTTRNTASAAEADEMAKLAQEAASRGAADTRDMQAAIEAISASSGDIAEIVKTIDGIAFQTNILALNAAVEAARAGEAGMGFAVVADEVRQLARRSAEAARETTEKIHAAIANTQSGVSVTARVAAALNDIAGEVARLGSLVNSVSSASHEQSRSMETIHSAVGELNTVIQSNAANAEESAAAAEELNAQAESMKHAVSQLLLLVGRAA